VPFMVAVGWVGLCCVVVLSGGVGGEMGLGLRRR
jgi:hypothetical protein